MSTLDHRFRLSGGLACLVVTFSLAISAAAGDTTQLAPLNLCDQVRARPRYPGKIRASEVCMRSLRPRPINDSDPHDTLEAIRDFHVTRLEWTYGLTAKFIAKVNALGCTASGAISNGSLLGISRNESDWFLRYSALNLDGEAVEAPWMRAWPGHALWHCVNNPAAREAYLAYAKDQIDQGVRDLQRDDPTMNYHATRWGGCFCKYCIRGFQAYLAEHATPELLERFGIQDASDFDYAEYLRNKNAPVGDAFARYPEDDLKRLFITFQEQSTIEFHRWWRSELNRYAGRYVPVSSNNGAHDFGPIHRLFDYHIGELSYSRAQPESLYDIARQVEQLGKGQTVTMPLRREAEETREWIDTTRRTIATAYAMGMHIEVPWDTYLPVREATHPPRYFGRPEDFSDLLAMVRAEARLLDNYEMAAATGGMIDQDRGSAESAPVTVWSRSTRVIAVARALPGEPDAPIVVHLVDWSAEPEPFTVCLNPQSLFAGRSFRCSLITPKAYDRNAHRLAFESRDYRPLVQEVALSSGPVTALEVPRLRPWGILVLRLGSEPVDIWPPRFILSDRNGEPAVAIAGAGAGAEVRFTTDSSEPGEDAAVYREPIPIRGCDPIRARVCCGSRWSATSNLTHLPESGWLSESLLINGDFSQGAEGWRSIVSGELAGRDALAFHVERCPYDETAHAAKLEIKASDGVPYHLRLVQPVSVRNQANLYVTATLAADHPTRVRFGLQERHSPFRVLHVGIFEIGTTPRRVRLSMANPHPGLEAQLQLDLGYCKANTTVWLSDVRVRELAISAGQP